MFFWSQKGLLLRFSSYKLTLFVGLFVYQLLGFAPRFTQTFKLKLKCITLIFF